MRHTSCLLAALALAGPATAVAQGSRLQAGVEAAVVFAKFTGDDAAGAETRTGVAGGGFLRFPIGGGLAFEPALLYSTQGTTIDAGGGITGTFKLDYWLLPLRLRLAAPLGPNPAFRPYLYVAPTLGLRDRCRIKVEAQGQSLEADCDDDAIGATFDTRTFEASVHFGAGLEYQRLALGLRYQLGLSSVDGSGSNADLKNRVVAIVGSYRFGGPR